MTTELTYPELISEVHRLSSEKQNGTIFITSTDGHIVRIVLDEGVITDLIFDSNHSGSEAIPYIQAIKLARIQFLSGSFESYHADILPSTEKIFAQLSAKSNGLSISINLNKASAKKIILAKSSDLSTSTTTTPEKYNDSPISTDLNKDIEYIKIALAAYIGPIANILCDEYLQQIKPNNTKSDITIMIETLALEIEKPNEQELFKKNILKKYFLGEL